MNAIRDLPVLVVGGGLGGLTLAAALGRQGRPVHVLEQATRISPIGYGIQLGPNVFDVLSPLRVADAVKAVADYPPSLRMPDAGSGETLMQVPLRTDGFARRFKHPYVVVHRADIHEILLDACRKAPAVELTVNAAVTHFADLGDRVRVWSDDGRQFEGAALVGADGLKSRIRGTLVADAEPKATGYVAHRTTLDMKDVPPDLPYRDDVVLWAGPGYHVVHYPLRRGTVFNVVAVFRNTAPEGGDPRATYQEEVRHVYAQAHPALQRLLAMMNLDRRWSIADRDPIRQWSAGRVTLLGDAAHPTLQSYAQGAGMAIEDAGCLAQLLTRCGQDYARAFAEYPRRRVLRTSRIQLGSRRLWEIFHADGIARSVRDAELRERGPEAAYDCFSWIWSGDPTLARA